MYALTPWPVMTAEKVGLPPRPKKVLQQRRRLALADRRIDLRRVVAGGLAEEPHPGLDRATLRVGRAIIEPTQPSERDGAGAHGAGLQRDIEVAVHQPFGADGFGGLTDRQDFGMC